MSSIVLPNGFEYSFVKQASVWKPVLARINGGGLAWDQLRTDFAVSLTTDSANAVLQLPNGTTYRFNAAGKLVQIRFPGGYQQNLTYANDLNTRVADNQGNWVEFTYGGTNLPSFIATAVLTSDGKRISYAYDNRYVVGRPAFYAEQAFHNDFWALKSVTYPDATPSSEADNPKRVYEYLADRDSPFLLTGVTDERGVRFATWTYDADGRATSSEHTGGVDHWQFVYDDVGNKVTVTNPLGRQTSYAYRRTGPLRHLTSVDGIVTSNCVASNTRYEYDANGRRSKAIDAEGRLTTWTYNSKGLPLTETQAAQTPLQRTRAMTWDATRPLMLSLAVPGLATSYTYDPEGRVLTVTETDTTRQSSPYVTRGQRRTTTYTYAPFSEIVPGPLGPLTVDGPLPGPSDTVRYAYDASGDLVSVMDELGHVTRVTRLDAGGRPLSVTDFNGVVTAMAYDARGRLTTVTVNPGATQARTLITYDAVGQVTRVTAPDRSYLQYTWNDARRLTSVVNNGRERIDYGYNANGDVISRTVRSPSRAIVRQQSALFDELGRLMRSIGAAGQQTLLRYDRTDNLTQVQDPRGGLFGYAYDGLQNLASLTDQAGSSVRLTRDGQGAVAAYSDPRGLTTGYVRNGFGEVIQESGPDLGTTVILRDERGLATQITDPRGVVTLLTYDAAGRLLTETYPADPTQNVTYSYDNTSNGNKGIVRLTGITDGSGTLSRYYDALGRVIAETRTIGGKPYSLLYGYNAADRLTSITYPSGRTVSYTRDALGRVTAITTQQSASATPQSVASAIGWSPMSSRLTALTHGNGLTTALAYDGDGRLVSLRLNDGINRVADLSYAYGDGMNLTAVNDNVTAVNSVSLAYDAAQRLASATGPWGSLTYGYTPNGDRAQESLTPPGGSALTTVLSYPATSNRLASTSVGSFATRSFSYDAAGNLLTQVMGSFQLSFAYNLRNRPVTLTRTGDGTQVSTYVYNALEQMVQRTTTAPDGPVGAMHYIYGLDGSLLAQADGATGITTREYIWLPQDDASFAADNDNEEGATPPPLPVGFFVNGVNTGVSKLLMVHADHLGRPIRMTADTRATVWSASYDPFGQLLQATGTVKQNLRFPGQYFLLESGLSYNWHRFYDAATGRYTQPDPLRFVDGPGVYGYAGASPMMRVDPEGEHVSLNLPDLCMQNPTACISLCLIIPSACGLHPLPTEPPMCMGPSEDHALKECNKAADGSDDDWRFFCNGSSFFGSYDKSRPARCQKESNSSNTAKRNWCYNEYGN